MGIRSRAKRKLLNLWEMPILPNTVHSTNINNYYELWNKSHDRICPTNFAYIFSFNSNTTMSSE